MTVFLLADSKSEAKNILVRILDIIIPSNEIIMLEDTGELECCLRSQFYINLMTILLPADIEELMRIIALQNLFGDIPIILILPDRQKNTIALGHKLRPRFVAYADGDFSDVATVLLKMKDKIESRNDYL